LGNQVEALHNFTDRLEMEFVLAQTVEQYQTVRQHALEWIKIADSRGGPQFAFQASVIAADSAYFAAEGCSNANDGDLWLIRSLEGLHECLQRAKDCKDKAYLAKLASLVGGAASGAMARYFLPDTQARIDAALRAIAAKVDNVFPASFEFPDEPEKTAQIAEVLAMLVDRYGPADSS
jgi:hypothetical protein